MEDAHSIVVPFAGIRGQGFFAIFDGHAGKQAAEWCGQNFATVSASSAFAPGGPHTATHIASPFTDPPRRAAPPR